jgi:hypothetical protein
MRLILIETACTPDISEHAAEGVVSSFTSNLVENDMNSSDDRSGIIIITSSNDSY